MLFFSPSWSQKYSNSLDTIGVYNRLSSIKFIKGDERITKREFEDLMRKEPTTYHYYRKGNSMNLMSNILSFGGSIVVFGSIISILHDSESGLIPGAIGIGLVVISFPLSSIAEKHFKKAADKYNHSQNSQMGFWDRSSLQLFMGSNTVGFSLKL